MQSNEQNKTECMDAAQSAGNITRLFPLSLRKALTVLAVK